MEQSTLVVSENNLTPPPTFQLCRFDGKGGCQSFAVAQLAEKKVRSRSSARAGTFDWYHLHRDSRETSATLKALKLDSFITDALMAEDTRPRFTVHGDGAIIILRGVNLNQGEEPTDMVSVRFWVEKNLVVGIWIKRIFAISDIRDSIDRGNVPSSPADLMARIAYRLVDRAEPIVATLSEEMDNLEESSDKGFYAKARKRLIAVRQSAGTLRRFLVTQRDALTTFSIEDMSWLDDRQRSRIRESAERFTRLGEELDAIKDRAMITHDEMLSERADRMNRTMLVLAVVTAVFLPLGLVTGLLGINVGGIPGTNDPHAFYFVTGGIALMGIALWLLIRRSGMMG
jgi:zinc transporter